MNATVVSIVHKNIEIERETSGFKNRGIEFFVSGIMKFYKIPLEFWKRYMRFVQGHPPLNPLPSREGKKRIVAWNLISLSPCGRGLGRGVTLIPGPLTPAKAAHISLTAKEVVIEDFTKIFLNYKELVKFQRTHKLYFQFAFKLAHVVVNLFGVKKREFLRHVGQTSGKMTVSEI